MVVTNELAVGPVDWLVDKRVLGHNSAAGKVIPHAAQRAGLKVPQKVTQHPKVDLRLFRAVRRSGCIPVLSSEGKSDSTACRYDVKFELIVIIATSSSISVTQHALMK